MKPIEPSEIPEHLELINHKNFQTAPSQHQHIQSDLFDEQVPELSKETEETDDEAKVEIPDALRFIINVSIGEP